MAESVQNKSVCTSIFKSTDNKISVEEFTKKWVELINRLERNKVSAPKA